VKYKFGDETNEDKQLKNKKTN